ncbi:Arc family DNA-binding protein [Brucella anthropi]|uniref:Arc family DNA-binding protein n=1 Tax=Brucella anthropi TaxID=529 RepID=UPI0005BB75EF|nr:Arc family DNA-binding protein [Brucella anthropi]KIU68408.1 hypothetical protein TR92_11080 [Brucella anthropi]
MSEVRITLRLPDDVRDQIAAAAIENGRSMNAEIIARIANFTPEKTLRDGFASQALDIVFSKNEVATLILDDGMKKGMKNAEDVFAGWAYTMADAMIAARGGNDA